MFGPFLENHHAIRLVCSVWLSGIFGGLDNPDCIVCQAKKRREKKRFTQACERGTGNITREIFRKRKMNRQRQEKKT